VADKTKQSGPEYSSSLPPTRLRGRDGGSTPGKFGVLGGETYFSKNVQYKIEVEMRLKG
jgi:hypothetical protein